MSSIVVNHLMQMYKTALSSVKGDKLIKELVYIKDGELLIDDKLNSQKFAINLNGKLVYIIGAGKAVFDLCHGFLSLIDSYNFQNPLQKITIESGILSIPFGIETSSNLFKKYQIQLKYGARNNFPDENSFKTTQEILNLIKFSIKPKSKFSKVCVIAFISGGGSALLVSPKSWITFRQKKDVIKKLASSGCTINELNQVRKYLSSVKGGQLALNLLQNHNNIELINFIASDVINDPIDVIASGPTVINLKMDNYSDAIFILDKYKINPELSFKHDEKKNWDLNVNQRLKSILVLSNKLALKTIKDCAQEFGYQTIEIGGNIQGEASTFVSKLIKIGKESKKSKVCWIGGGETTVQLSPMSNGIGGRCQEMALQFFIETYIHECEDLALLAAGTDGQDGPTPVAGCVYFSKNIKSLEKSVLEKAKTYLEQHNSYNFWFQNFPHCLINTNGPTGVNVMDIYCMIKV